MSIRVATVASAVAGITAIAASPPPAPVLSSLTITPSAATLAVGSSQQFAAQALDQQGKPRFSGCQIFDNHGEGVGIAGAAQPAA